MSTARPGSLHAWRQWPRDTRDTLFLLAVIAVTALPHLGHLPLWCTGLTAGVLAWRARLALRQLPLPGRWLPLTVLALALALTLWTERSLLGREAGVTLLVLLMALKTLELRARRDAVVVFFLGFFMVLTTSLYSQSLGAALAMGAATWGLLTALVLANMPVGRPPLRQAAGVAARAVGLGLPLMLALFLLFPRLGPLWGLPQDAVGRTGLSGTLRMGGVAGVANDDSIAFRVRFDGPPPPAEQLYFRGPVLSQFDGIEWVPAALPGGRVPLRPAEVATDGPPLRYELLIEPMRLALLPLLEITPRLPDDPALQAHWAPWLGPDLVWHTDQPVTDKLRIRASAWPLARHGQALDERERQAQLRLPPGANPRTLAWARQLRSGFGQRPDEAVLAQAVLAHIRQGDFTYTLEPGPYGDDGVDAFWFDRKLGFCEHFATGFVVVMRAMGVPARVVTGYQGAEPPDPDGFRTVRQSHAHAWAEYWQPGPGWRRADPTAAVAPERVRASRALPVQPGLVGGALRSMNPALAQRLRQTWELLDSRWTQWVVGYSRQRQFSLLESLGLPHTDLSDLLRVLGGGVALAGLGGVAWALWDRRRHDPWQRAHGRLIAQLQRAGLAAQAHHGLRTLATLVQARHGPAGAALVRALHALDAARHGPGGQRLPARLHWRAVDAALRQLPAPPPAGAASGSGAGSAPG